MDLYVIRKFSPHQISTLGGVIEVRGVLGTVVENLGCRIVAGEWAPGAAIPKEADLGEELQVSRSVVREAIRILGAKGMIRGRTSDGTRIQQRSEWRLLDPDVMDWRIKAGDTSSLLRDLLKVRLVLEPGLVYGATLVATDEYRKLVKDAWEAKLAVYKATEQEPVERRRQFITTDLDFHRAFLTIVRSELLDQLFAVIEAALELLLDLQMKARGYTSKLIGMDESMELHEAVYLAFMAKDPNAAETAMRKLIERAIADAHDGFKLLNY